MGVDRHTLVGAFKARRIRGAVDERGYYHFDTEELDEDFAALPTCKYVAPDATPCDRKAFGESGGCEKHGHVFAGARAAGVKRPDIGPKISAAKTGKLRPDLVEPMRARMTKYPAEQRQCLSCGKSLGTILGWVIRRGGGKFCLDCVLSGDAGRWLWEHQLGGRRGKVVTCKCGKTTRYLSPSQFGIVYCKHCFATHPDTRAKRSEATRRTLRRPDAKLKMRLARWGKFGNAYFDRTIEEFERLRRGGAPKKAELHGRWLAMFRGSDAELEEMLKAAPGGLSRLRAIALLDWQRHPADWPRDKWPPSRFDPDDLEANVLPAARERVKKALQRLGTKPKLP